MKQSESIKELATALSKAQAEIEGAKKDSTNPFFKSSYADLTSVIDAIKEPLAKHGLSISQMTDFDDDGREFVETQIMHSSGEWLRGRLLLKAKDDSPQAQGSSLSYSRRYSLQAALCVSALDDDANSAQMNKSYTNPGVVMPTSAVNSPRHNEDFDFFDSPVKKTLLNTSQPSASGAKELVLLFGPDKGKPLSKLTKSQLSKDIEYWESRSRKEAKPLTGEVKNMVDEMKRLLLQK